MCHSLKYPLMPTFQTIVRKGSFDSGHRVMNECMKCFNIHGHTYLYEIEFMFTSMESIGYAIDFKEIKRVACQWIDDILDHGMLLNPRDTALIETTRQLGSKLWLMSLAGPGQYCNPTVENIAKELFLAMELLFTDYPSLSIHKVTLHETPSCYTVCQAVSISQQESNNFALMNGKQILQYAMDKGVVCYDDRKLDQIQSSVS